jgi:hypothetical protein
MSKPWDDDQRLMDDLIEAIQAAGPISGTVADHAQSAWCWRTVDEELLVASLSFDSLDEPVGVLRAAPGEPRTLVFTAAPLSIELEINARGVLGQVVPPGEGEITVEGSDGTVVGTMADDLGFFVFPTIPQGPVRLRCETATGRLVTHWVRL